MTMAEPLEGPGHAQGTDQATRTTLPAFIHLVQTRTRRGSLFTMILARCRLGSHRRFVRGARSSQEPL